MKRKILFISFLAPLLAIVLQLPAQVVITNDSTAPDNSAMLDVKSTSKGLVIPRLTVEQIQAISNPAVGLMVYCTTDENYYIFTGEESVSGKSPAGGWTWQSLSLGGIPPISLACQCIWKWPQPPSTYIVCLNTTGFYIDWPGFIVGACSGTRTYLWSGPGFYQLPSLIPVPLYVDPANLPCGKYTYTWSALEGTNIKCTKDYIVYVYPKCLTIKNLITGISSDCLGPQVEFCEGHEGILSTGCTDFDVSWDFKDDNKLYSETWCPPTSSPPYCTDNPIYTNQLDILCTGSCPSTSPATDCFVLRTYRATFGRPPAGWPLLWPSSCPYELTIPAKIYCLTVAGSIVPTPVSSHVIQSAGGNVYKICSNNNAGCTTPPVYPIKLRLDVNNRTGHITQWNTGGTGTSPFYPLDINQAGTYVYTVTVLNGICGTQTTSITVIVEDPFCPLINSTKDLVCPNTTDDVISLANASDLPPGALIQWQYQINCTGPWYPAPNYLAYDPSNGTSQNTNLIGDQNPWYKPPRATLLTSSLCWQVVITPAPGSPCSAGTYSAQYPAPFHGRIDLFEKPGIPGISVSPLPPQCCGTTFTLTATPPATGTQPFYYEWFHNGQSEWPDPGPGPGSVYVVTAPGDYYVRVYNKDHCEYTESTIIHITCCSVDLSVSAPCCSDGVTPINLVATGISTCPGNNPVTYSWTGTNGFTSTLGTAVLNPPPTYPPLNWIYTVTATDGMGCHNSKTVTILACP